MNKTIFGLCGALALIMCVSASAAFADVALPLRVALGADSVGSFVADSMVSNLTETGADAKLPTPEDVNLSKVKDPAPKEVYQTSHFGGDMTFKFTGFKANAKYTLRLHFSENCIKGPGLRIFDVLINQKAVLTEFDIFKDAGGMNIADIKTFDTTADASGNITLECSSQRANGADNALINGVEIMQPAAK